ncbi:MAG TPA: DUF1674 domain-containing protein [Acetobacteraceae bacterium]|nr:DUF1674 domain-containing protein [Acetobacteraceae bacterium]
MSEKTDAIPPTPPVAPEPKAPPPAAPVKEIGGPPGPDPTRYGDWERKGRCIDF